MLDRRAVLQTLLAAGVAVDAAAAASPAAPPAARTPRDDLMLWARLTADLAGTTTYSLTAGTVWGFKPQADDLPLADFARRLYGYHNLVARKARVTPDGDVAIRQKGWIFYQHPDTGAFVRELANPYTGKIDPALPMSGPATETIYTPAGPKIAGVPYPVEMAKTERPFDLRVRVVGDHAFVTETMFTRLQPGGISWWKLEGQLISHACRAADLGNAARTHIPNTWSHNLVAEWQTWMGMHGTPGHILFKGEGCAVDPHALPSDLAAALETEFPGQLAAVAAWDRG
jgi:hypothetical protein